MAERRRDPTEAVNQWFQNQSAKTAAPNHEPSTNGSPAKKAELADILKAHLQESQWAWHSALMAMTRQPQRWLVEGLIPDEALVFFGGKKKLGKSWFALQLAQAIAAGMPFLGRPTEKGPVLYLCLEDGKNRLCNRLDKQQARKDLPICYYWRFPPLDGDGLGLLIGLLDTIRPKLVIIDTLAACKSGKIDENAAGPLADLANTLRALAQHFCCTILVVHHHGKHVATGDPGNDLRGTSALGGAADVTLGLYREESIHYLRAEGRDIVESSLRLTFDPEHTWCWHAADNQSLTAQQQADQDIILALGALGEATAGSVAEVVGKSREACRRRLLSMATRHLALLRTEPGGDDGGKERVLFRLR